MKECITCLLTDDIEGVTITETGECNFCKLHDDLSEQYPVSSDKLIAMVEEIRKRGKNHKYDVLIGISGGCDSSWLLHSAQRWGLRILALHMDNSWNTEIADQNIANLIAKIGCTFIRITPNMKEYNKLNYAFLKASVSEADIPNDIAMGRLMLDVAMQNDCVSIFNGHSFRTEGSCPIGWTRIDGEYVRDVFRHQFLRELKFYPVLTFWVQILASLKGIKHYRPLYYMNYNKDQVKKDLAVYYNWKDYGGHHTENRYTEFIGWLLYTKFGIDKRRIEQSAFIREGLQFKEVAKEELKRPIEIDWKIVEEVKNKLFISDFEWEGIMHSPRRNYHDYKNYNFKKFKWLFWVATKLGFFPETFFTKYCK